MKKYQIIYADPPWRYRDKRQNPKTDRPAKYGGISYKTLSLEEICNISVGNIADDNSVLFLWTTMPMLEDSFSVIRAWGFKYRTMGFTWVKTNKCFGYYFGLGSWTRANPELCLLGVRGKPKRIDNCVEQLVVSDLMEHSHKPAIIREKIVQLMGDLPRIELFARRKVEGWDCWGNEIESDIEL